MLNDKISIAIETSCRFGGVALGRGDQLIECKDLGKSRQHASRLPAELDALFTSHGLKPADLDHVFVSAGPGSYTGLRVAMAFASTLATTNSKLKIVSVPTALAIAERVSDRPWEKIAVALAAKDNAAWSVLIDRPDGTPKICEGPVIYSAEEILQNWGSPLLLTGEATGYMDLPENDDLTIIPEEERFPLVEGIWAVGRRMALEGTFTAANQIGPIYARKPEAVRLWEKRNPGS